MEEGCKICNLVGTESIPLVPVFPYLRAPASEYWPENYRVCLSCAQNSQLFDEYHGHVEYGEYHFFIHYDCKCCTGEHCISLDELETAIDLGCCPIREIECEFGTFPSFEKLKKYIPVKYFANDRWKKRELEFVSDHAESARKKRLIRDLSK